MKSISKSNVYVQDQLFATLDTTTRKIESKVHYNFLLSDTVGFIRSLPHDLIASFRSTLMEIEESDLILKIVDSSSNNIKIHLSTIKDVLETLEITSKLDEVIVFNKIDLISIEKLNELRRLYPKSLFISAKKELKINELLDEIHEKLSELNEIVDISIPYSKIAIIDYIYKTSKVFSREDEYEGVKLKIESSSANIKKLKFMIK
jgi:GTP-binding protein HflX